MSTKQGCRLNHYCIRPCRKFGVGRAGCRAALQLSVALHSLWAPRLEAVACMNPPMMYPRMLSFVPRISLYFGLYLACKVSCSMVSHGGRATSELASLPKGLLCGWVSAGRERARLPLWLKPSRPTEQQRPHSSLQRMMAVGWAQICIWSGFRP